MAQTEPGQYRLQTSASPTVLLITLGLVYREHFATNIRLFNTIEDWNFLVVPFELQGHHHVSRLIARKCHQRIEHHIRPVARKKTLQPPVQATTHSLTESYWAPRPFHVSLLTPPLLNSCPERSRPVIKFLPMSISLPWVPALILLSAELQLILLYIVNLRVGGAVNAHSANIRQVQS